MGFYPTVSFKVLVDTAIPIQRLWTAFRCHPLEQRGILAVHPHCTHQRPHPARCPDGYGCHFRMSPEMVNRNTSDVHKAVSRESISDVDVECTVSHLIIQVWPSYGCVSDRRPSQRDPRSVCNPPREPNCHRATDSSSCSLAAMPSGFPLRQWPQSQVRIR